MAWDYYNLTQGHSLKCVRHLFSRCRTSIFNLWNNWFKVQNLFFRGAWHLFWGCETFVLNFMPFSLKVQDIWVKTHSKEPKKMTNVKFYYKKLNVFFSFSFETMVIMAHFFFLTHMITKRFKLTIHLINFKLNWFNQGLLKMNFFVIRKRHFYKGFSKDSYNKRKLLIKNMRWY
jgi:hypothetical protein